MRIAIWFVMALAICGTIPAGALAQLPAGASGANVSQPTSSIDLPSPQQSPPPPPPLAIALIPALTPVEVEIRKDLGSKISKPGDKFPIRLHQAIILNGKEMIPAGTAGVGEVVEAKPAGMSGVSGILILAARYLDVDGHPLRLRSMRLAEMGKSKIGIANNVGLAAAVVFPVASVAGLFVSGNEILVPYGSVAGAKTAVDFALPAVEGNTSAANASMPRKGENK